MYRHGKDEIEAVARVLASGKWFRYGERAKGVPGEATALEAEWRAHTGAPHAAFTTSGSSALLMAYAGLGLGPGDEVIVPGYTWLSTALCPLALGVIPVIADVNESLMLDPASVERAITPRTKAICPVHMNGLACDMDAMREIARRRKLLLIEDACQADGGLWTDGTKLGTLGDAGAYSFNYYKVIACGDGGMLVCRDDLVFERGLIYHDAGMGFRSGDGLRTPVFVGINLRGNEILAAVMRAQLVRLPGIVADLHRVRAAVLGELAAAGGPPQIPLNGGAGCGTGASMGFRFPDEKAARAFSAALDEAGCPASGGLPIDTGPHVYTQWEAVMNRRGGPHPDLDAFRHPRNASAPAYSKDMLPRTLGILSSTVLVGVNPDWTADEVKSVSAAIAKAGAAAR